MFLCTLGRWAPCFAVALALLSLTARPAEAQRRRYFAPGPAAAPAAAAPATRPMPLTYPASAKTDQTDDYHGTKVADPYRWLEDLDGPQTKAWVASEDGKLLAYGLAAAGSDWQEWHVLEVDSGRKTADQLKWIKFSRVAWTPDGKGFFYSRYDEPPPGEQYTKANYFQKLFYHRLGEPQEKDSLIYKRDDEKEWGFDGEVTDDGRYLVISVWRGTEQKNQVFYKDFKTPDSPVVELLAGFDAEYEFIDSDGTLFWLVTDLDAPLRRVIAIDTRQPARDNWKELIP